MTMLDSCLNCGNITRRRFCSVSCEVEYDETSPPGEDEPERENEDTHQRKRAREYADIIRKGK